MCSNGVAASIGHTSCSLLADVAVIGLVPPPRHVVVAPVEDTVFGTHFLLLRFAILGGNLLPCLILLLILFVGGILLVAILGLLVLLVVAPLSVTFLGGGLLQVGAEGELTLQGSQLSLHGNDAFLVKRLCTPSAFLLEQVVLVGGKQDQFIVRNDEGAIGVCLVLAFDVLAKVGARDGSIGAEQDVNWIVDQISSCDDLRVIVVEVGVNQLNIALDGHAVCTMPAPSDSLGGSWSWRQNRS